MVFRLIFSSALSLSSLIHPDCFFTPFGSPLFSSPVFTSPPFLFISLVSIIIFTYFLVFYSAFFFLFSSLLLISGLLPIFSPVFSPPFWSPYFYSPLLLLPPFLLFSVLFASSPYWSPFHLSVLVFSAALSFLLISSLPFWCHLPSLLLRSVCPSYFLVLLIFSPPSISPLPCLFSPSVVSLVFPSSILVSSLLSSSISTLLCVRRRRAGELTYVSSPFSLTLFIIIHPIQHGAECLMREREGHRGGFLCSKSVSL